MKGGKRGEEACEGGSNREKGCEGGPMSGWGGGLTGEKRR